MDGHFQQFEGQQRNLQKLLKQWDDNDCGGKGFVLPALLMEFATRPTPFPFNRLNDRFSIPEASHTEQVVTTVGIGAILLIAARVIAVVVL